VERGTSRWRIEWAAAWVGNSGEAWWCLAFGTGVRFMVNDQCVQGLCTWLELKTRVYMAFNPNETSTGLCIISPISYK
jgi:hypothetical protein